MKWIDKMVERITRKETALNDHFCVNRHTVVCQSGMTDYVSVTIDNTDGFDFDFCIYNHRTTKTNQKYPSVNL